MSIVTSSRRRAFLLVQVDIDVVELMAEKGSNPWATVHATEVETLVCVPLNCETSVILVDSILA